MATVDQARDALCWVIVELCEDARKHTRARSFGYAANSLDNAKRAAASLAALRGHTRDAQGTP